MISLEQYLMGRDKIHPPSKELLENAGELLLRVHMLMGLLGFKDFKISSGYRPNEFNTRSGGAKRSAHVTCEAIDIRDPKQIISSKIKENIKLLEECELYMEDPSFTVDQDVDGNYVYWVHLQTRPTTRRVFRPY